jgi:hypothetical protein
MAPWTTRTEYREIVTLIGKQEDAKAAMDYLHTGGFSIAQSGPFSNKEMWPKVDITRFKFIAWRDMEGIEFADRAQEGQP